MDSTMKVIFIGFAVSAIALICFLLGISASWYHNGKNKQIDAIEKIVKEIFKKMATVLELLTTANLTLDNIDATTTAEGAEVKALADAYEALKAEIGKDKPEVVAALEELNARLFAKADDIANIYTAPPVAEEPVDPSV